MKNVDVIVKVDGLKGLVKTLKELADSAVLVGVPADDRPDHEGSGKVGPNARKSADGTASSAMNNATLLYIHENGSPAANIPARPSLNPGVQRARDHIEKRLRDAADAALNGNDATLDRNLHAAGLEAQTSIRKVITEGIPPPLKPATVRARRRRTKGGKYRRKATSPAQATPLIDTGQLLASISYVVERGKGKAR